MIASPISKIWNLVGFYYCPHYPNNIVQEFALNCCRKPQPGMLFDAATRHDIDMQSWFIDDILNDVEASHLAGCRTILSDNGNEIQWQLSPRSLHYPVADLSEVRQLITSVDIKPLIHFLPVVENTGEQ